MRNLGLVMLLNILFIACSGENANKKTDRVNQEEKEKQLNHSELDTAYFASGCFWCVEAIYESVKGVEEAVSGFAGGSKKTPTYEEVARGNTDHAETVMVFYDPDKVSFQTLVKVYYGSQDPTTVGQDPDFGPQYRSIIFYTNKREKRIAQQFKESLANSGKYKEPIVTEIKKLETFWPADKYHQDYEKKHPNKAYIQQVSKPRLERFKKKFPELVD